MIEEYFDKNDLFNEDDYVKVFFDTEFTGLHKNTSLISIGLLADVDNVIKPSEDFDINDYSLSHRLSLPKIEQMPSFYGECFDYNKNQVDEWLDENVIKNLRWNREHPFKYFNDLNNDGKNIEMNDWSFEIRDRLKEWLQRLHDETGKKILFYSDCYAYDWVLLVELLTDHKSAIDMPEYCYYIPIDLSTELFSLGIDPDINREQLLYSLKPNIGQLQKSYSEIFSSRTKHNALWDAFVIFGIFTSLKMIKTEEKSHLMKIKALLEK